MVKISFDQGRDSTSKKFLAGITMNDDIMSWQHPYLSPMFIPIYRQMVIFV